MKARLLAACLGFGLVTGCSALALHDSKCEFNDDCVAVFGAGAGCSPDGTCQRCTPEFELADFCNGSLKAPQSCPGFALVSTQGFSDDVDNLDACLDESPIGNDGFFELELEKDERWHMHVQVADGTAGQETNPAVYVLKSCDERVCELGNGVDRCGNGGDEHMTFVAPYDGNFIVGIDDRNMGGAEYELLTLRPTCGNGGLLEHSESCDDGNQTPLDGCDASCRAEVRFALPDEVEPNDDYYAANVLMIDQTNPSVTVKAEAGGRCDFDNFAVAVGDVPAIIEATVTGPNGEECAADAPEITLELLRAADDVQGTGTTVGGNHCPSFGANDGFATLLPFQEYVLRVFTSEDANKFDYELKVTLRPTE